MKPARCVFWVSSRWWCKGVAKCEERSGFVVSRRLGIRRMRSTVRKRTKWAFRFTVEQLGGWRCPLLSREQTLEKEQVGRRLGHAGNLRKLQIQLFTSHDHDDIQKSMKNGINVKKKKSVF